MIPFLMCSMVPDGMEKNKSVAGDEYLITVLTSSLSFWFIFFYETGDIHFYVQKYASSQWLG